MINIKGVFASSPKAKLICTQVHPTASSQLGVVPASGFSRRWAPGYLAWASCSRGSLKVGALSDQAGSSCCSGVLRG